MAWLDYRRLAFIFEYEKECAPIFTVFNPSLQETCACLFGLWQYFNMSDRLKHHTNQAYGRFAGGVCGGPETKDLGMTAAVPFGL